LSWRLSPEVSLSDWKICVKKTGHEVIKTNHVHRAILGIGVRSCKYFSRLLSSSQAFAESVMASDLAFEEDTTVDAFSTFLDYVYTGELSVCTISAVALLDLADYLGCKAAYEEVQKFVRDDLSAQTSPAYIREASKYGADKILAAALRMCATSFRTILPANLLCLPPDLFVGLVTGSGFECDSEVLSERVVGYLEEHVDEVNGDLVSVLTSNSIMPFICPDVALQLLRLGLEHGVANEDGARSLQMEEEEVAPAKKKQKKKQKEEEEEEEGPIKKNEALVSLQQRCLESLHENYDVLQTSNLDGLPADITIALLKGGLDAAASAKDEAVKESDEEFKELWESHWKTVQELKSTSSQLADARAELTAVQQQMSTAHAENQNSQAALRRCERQNQRINFRS